MNELNEEMGWQKKEMVNLKEDNRITHFEQYKENRLAKRKKTQKKQFKDLWYYDKRSNTALI